MEPTDLNSSANDDARLEALLRTATSPLPDVGFSARVIAALPSERPRTRSWRRIGFCAAGAAMGCGLAIWRGASWPGVQSGLGELGVALVDSCGQLANPIFAA